LLGLLLLPGLRAAESLEQSFQSALLAEEARRDIDAAIRGYEAVIAQVDAQRALAATAVFRLGECYRKVGRTNDAVAQYQRLLRDFPAESTLARLSRENLLALGAMPREATSTNDAPSLAAPTPPLDEEQVENKRLGRLLNSSPDLLDAPVEGRTPLFQAAAKGQLMVVKTLINWRADVNSNRSANRETALHAAAAGGHKAVVEALLEAKADPNATSAQGRTPLSIAAGLGYTAVVETLLKRGAKPGLEPDHAALFAAVEAGRTNLIERLVKSGADVNAVRSPTPPGVSPVRPRTPLSAAVTAGQRGASQTLIRLGAVVTGPVSLDNSVPHASKDVVFRQPLDVDWVREVLAAAPKEGFPPGQLNELLRQVIDRGRGREEVIPLLIAAGADVNAMVEDGRMPLVTLAAYKASARALELMLAAKPDVNAVAHDGKTALHVAAQRGDTNKIARLLQAGADPNRLDRGDRTPLSIAREQFSGARGNRRRPIPTPVVLEGAGGAVGLPVGESTFSGLPPVAVGGQTNDFEKWSAIESMLLAAGAREDMVRRLSVHWRRGQESGVLLRRAGEDPAPSLADILVMTFKRDMLQWPDLTAIRVFRLSDDGTAEREIRVRKDWESSDGCDWNIALEWGDAIEVPEMDRVSDAPWPGLTETAKLALWRCSVRRVALTVKGETVDLELRPAPTSWVNKASRGINPKNPPASAPGAWRELDSCELGTVLSWSRRLRISSDLTQVRVTRKAIGQSWTLDVENDVRAKSFWLIDGDHIEVPEKTP
jgi:ankyrin repeat protein